jgi:protein tyrosine/serine phosphatase
MKMTIKRAVMAALATATLSVLCSCATLNGAHGIPNFDRVEEDVFRGGQPTDEGWRYLQSLGVTNVVKLNKENEGSDAEAEALGMTVHRFPISLKEQMWGRVNSNTVWNAVQCITTHTFIHCEHGQDRTGLVVACDRVAMNTPKHTAEQEMLQHGFHKSLRGLWAFWKHRVPISRPGSSGGESGH